MVKGVETGVGISGHGRVFLLSNQKQQVNAD
jgi:hypothetical protein